MSNRVNLSTKALVDRTLPRRPSRRQWLRGAGVVGAACAATAVAAPPAEAAASTGTFNVKDFGALGDGTTDDTAAIQAAIDAARGLPVLLPAGNYSVTGLHNVPGIGLTLAGDGPQSALSARGSAAVLQLCQTQSASLHEFRSFQILGNSASAGGILLGSPTFYAAFIRMSDVGVAGFSATGAFGMYLGSVQELDAINCFLYKNYNNVYHPNSGYVTSTRFSGMRGYIGGATNRGVLFDGRAADLTFRSQVLESNAREAIKAVGAQTNIIIDGCYFEDNARGGGDATIYVSGSAAWLSNSRLVLMNSHFYRATGVTNPRPQLKLDHVSSGVVSGNVGLNREGQIQTSVNTQCHFSHNNGGQALNDTAPTDMVALYESLPGNISWDETRSDGLQHLSAGVLTAKSAHGATLGAISGTRRIQYGSDDPNAFSLLTDGDGFASLYAKNVICRGALTISPVSIPSPTTGGAVIYIDSADGNLKVMFGDGTVKTISAR